MLKNVPSGQNFAINLSLKKGLDLWEKYFMLLQQHAISNIFKITYAVIIQRDFYSKNLDSG